MFTDTHCHLFSEYYDNIEEVVKVSSLNQVNRYINAACDIKSIEEVLKLINMENVYGVIGIHPENVDSFKSSDLEYIEANLNNPKIVGIGEIGLDYYYTKENKEAQKRLFEDQLKLAEKYHLPVVVHSREATQDTIDILKKYQVKGVIHSFSGSLEVAKIYLKMGFKLGINGVVTFKNANIKDIIKEIGIENIVLETDSPYLTPTPFRGEKNHPGHVYEIAKFLSEYLDISMKKIAEITNENITQIFDI